MSRRDHRPAAPPIPPARSLTARRRIADLLAREALSARELAEELGVREREVVEHLEHLRRGRVRLIVTPAECLRCGFVFRKRGRLARPSRCPLCRSESIADPRFAVEEEA